MNEIDKCKLVELNKKVDDVIAERKKWLDSKMIEYSGLQVGDSICNRQTGKFLGVVSRLYRYWEKKDPLLDTLFDIDYEYCTGGNCFDNTSRQPYLNFGKCE